jgi:hypothetical protein
MGKNGRILFDSPQWAVVPVEEEESYIFGIFGDATRNNFNINRR